eukprot:765494-Hanusia_phi.AAC.3
MVSIVDDLQSPRTSRKLLLAAAQYYNGCGYLSSVFEHLLSVMLSLQREVRQMTKDVLVTFKALCRDSKQMNTTSRAITTKQTTRKEESALRRLFCPCRLRSFPCVLQTTERSSILSRMLGYRSSNEITFEIIAS